MHYAGPGGLPSPNTFQIEGCPESPCNVTRGTVIPFQAEITASNRYFL